MMLARAAERKLRRDAFRCTSNLTSLPSPSPSLSLPWLGSSSQTRRVATTTPPMAAMSNDARKSRSTSSHVSPRSDSRSIATSADTRLSSSSESMPFGNIMYKAWSTQNTVARKVDVTLDPFRPDKMLILRDPVAKPTTPTKFGIGGDTTELYQNLHACLRVGLMERATAIIERLAKMCSPSSPEVVEAHNTFLQAMFEMAEQNPTPDAMEELEAWYEKRMVRNSIEPTADTLITLLRASMTFLEGYDRTAALNKYLHVAQECGPGVLDAINNSDEFTETEWDQLIRIQSDRYKPPPPSAEAEQPSLSTPLGYATLVEQGFLPNPAHYINPVEQQGLGLESLKQSLALFDSTEAPVPYPHEMEGSREEKDRAYAYARQLRIENDSLGAAVRRWKAEDQKLQDIGIHGVLKSKPIQAFMWQWYSDLLPLFKKELARVKEVVTNPKPSNLRDERHAYGPYLQNIAPEKMAALTVSRVLESCARGTHADHDTLKVSSLTQSLGDLFEQEYQMDALSKHQAAVRRQRRKTRQAMLARLALGKDTSETEPSNKTSQETIMSGLAKYSRTEFPTAVKFKMGAMALQLLIKSATLTMTAEDPKTGKQLSNTQAAFQHHMSFVNGKKVGMLSPHAAVLEKLHKDAVHAINTKALPMVYEPKPWESIDVGGFWRTRNSVIRTKNSDPAQRAYAHTAIVNGDMDKVLAGLDVLGKVPWQINGKVFEVVAQAWNSEDSVGGLVQSVEIGERPAEPPSDASRAEVSRYIKALKQWENHKSGIHSQRCFQNFQLEIARAYVNEERLYFPHSVDFRGRAYPIPPLLNHIGADLARGLLRFANGKELGTVGLQWLRIQLANLYGFDKASLREREQFAIDNFDEICDSATNPLDGRRWWAQAEDPWQCLACCMELKAAMDSPDPTRYVSHLPVHQDGTCNGLQHYAALGGDLAGATQVNLEPSDRPQDIYTGVAELVKDMVVKDAAAGHACALFVQDKITRKVVKRTVMTNVYGVTFMGAKAQVMDELKDIFPLFQPTKEIAGLHTVALYVAAKIFAALGMIFNGAQEIQHWLGECGDRILTSLSPQQINRIRRRYGHTGAEKRSNRRDLLQQKRNDKNMTSYKTSIIWTTPLKMPVVQPYRKETTEVVKTSLQAITVAKHDSTSAINKRKQLQAFPPNFIHSLDATHMMLSALKCDEMGLNFAAVHDSFWTHAADIPNLNIILRDAFVRMHSEDIVGRLAAEFEARYAGHMQNTELLPGSEVVSMIIAWRKEHRKTSLDKGNKHMRDATHEELALEAERQELLNSEDPELRAKGKAMITPTSIWLAHADPKLLASRRLALLGATEAKSAANLDQSKERAPGSDLPTSSDLKSADASSDSVVAAAIEAESGGLDAAAADMDLQREASLAGTTEASIQSIKDTLMPDEVWADVEEEVEDAEDEDEDSSKKASRRIQNVCRVWTPLTFPPVPKKGTWDVSRLHKSEYFFS